MGLVLSQALHFLPPIYNLLFSIMARQEHDREDLLAEATALVERIELRLPEFTGSVVIGFRRDGCASVYFDGDPAWHFNTRGELRRAFVAGRLYKAEQGRLVALTRMRTNREVQLLRHELNDPEQHDLLRRLAQDLDQLRQRLEAGNCSIVGQAPAGRDVLPRIVEWLKRLPASLVVASRPHVE
jgi:hypothetical protein